uniref:Uncharacterized protein n=1 Tax=Ditylenchus dipsaci TaxID=166011 RepID=A0A915DP15_9BILA
MIFTWLVFLWTILVFPKLIFSQTLSSSVTEAPTVVSTTVASTALPATPPPPCIVPVGSVSISTYFPNSTEPCSSHSFEEEQQPDHTIDQSCPPIGQCECVEENHTKLIFKSKFYNNISLNDGPGMSVQCENQTELCVCTTAGQCFTALGEDLVSVDLYPYCIQTTVPSTTSTHSSSSSQVVVPNHFQYTLDDGICINQCFCDECEETTNTINNVDTVTTTYSIQQNCQMYAVLRCVNETDTAGLTNGIVNHTCAAQLNADGKMSLLGQVSPYVLVSSIGCGGCPNPDAQCGPFKAPYQQRSATPAPTTILQFTTNER